MNWHPLNSQRRHSITTPETMLETILDSELFNELLMPDEDGRVDHERVALFFKQLRDKDSDFWNPYYSRFHIHDIGILGIDIASVIGIDPVPEYLYSKRYSIYTKLLKRYKLFQQYNANHGEFYRDADTLFTNYVEYKAAQSGFLSGHPPVTYNQ